MSGWAGAGRTAIAGWGMSAISRDAGRPLGALAVDACRAAVADAGLQPADVDGLATFPDQPFRGAPTTDGVDLVSAGWLLDHLPLAPDVGWFAQVSDGMVVSAIAEGVNALLAGVCRHVLVWRAMRRPAGEYGGWTGAAAAGDDQFAAPYGLTSIIQTHAVAFRRYLHRHGADPDAMAALVVAQRANAARNPHAVFGDRPMTREDYLASPVVADPLRLLDCDVPVQGCAALVLTTTDRARVGTHPPARVLAHAQQTLPRRPVIEPLYTLQDHMACGASVTDALWRRAGVGPADVDVAQLYDGFSPSAWYWLEAAGFCAEGEAHAFTQDGRVALGGELPVNTAGGSLSEGRLHGMGHVLEAARQVTGVAGERQVRDAAVAVALDGSPMLRGSGLVLAA